MIQSNNGFHMGSASTSRSDSIPTIVSVCVLIINGRRNINGGTMIASRDFKLVVLLITFVPIIGKPMGKLESANMCCLASQITVAGGRDFQPEGGDFDESIDYNELCRSIACPKKRGGGPVQFDLLDYMHGMKQRAGSVVSTVNGLKNPVTVWTWEKGLHSDE